MQGLRELVDRLNRFPQETPPSESFYKILAMRFSEKEAELVALLPIKPFTAAQAACYKFRNDRKWSFLVLACVNFLKSLIEKGSLVLY